MTVSARDPKGYYAALGVAPGAPPSAIKAAYRLKAKDCHPDRNDSAEARDSFQRLSEAYAVLRDTVGRAEYDATGESGGLPGVFESSTADLLMCGQCGKITAQPRYVIFHQVKSAVLWSKWQKIKGVFCRDCAERTAIRASTTTWALGWWSIFGPPLTLLALLRNLFGGDMPMRENARVLLHQARAFRAKGDAHLARSVAHQARRFTRDDLQAGHLKALVESLGGESRQLKDRWRLGGEVFLVQLLPLAALPVVVAVAVLVASSLQTKTDKAEAVIRLQSAEVGDARHAAVDALKLRQAPGPNQPVLALLDRFTTVQVTSPQTDPEWVQVKTPGGAVGFVQARLLFAGSGTEPKRRWCRDQKGAPPENGTVLMRRAGGDFRLLVHNIISRDAVVKLKTPSGHTLLTFYVPAGGDSSIGGIPEGTFRIEFATGTDYSRPCGIFLADMVALRMPLQQTIRNTAAGRGRTNYELTLMPSGNGPSHPRVIEIGEFADDS